MAIIYRLSSTSASGQPRSALMVETIGRGGRPGCLVAIDRRRGRADANRRRPRPSPTPRRRFRCGSTGPKLDDGLNWTPPRPDEGPEAGRCAGVLGLGWPSGAGGEPGRRSGGLSEAVSTSPLAPAAHSNV